MKIKSFRFFTVLLLSTFFLASFSFSQSKEERRAQEHAAVKNYINQHWNSQPVNKNKESNTSGKTKYEYFREVYESFAKTQNHERRKSFFMNGNKISTDIFNYGGIGPGYGLLRGINNFVWNGLDYVFQFCPIVGASVPDANDPEKRLHIISDGLWDYPQQQLREANPDGTALWQWQPLPGYSDEESDYMASNPAEDADGDGKPDSWPRHWYNETLGRYVWPGYLKQDATNADLEVYWAMDDRDNVEFNYYPFPSDSSRKGIGVQVDGRAFQWSNALAENTIFFVYTITNTSEKDLDSVFFGIYGDPDIGGGSPENTDDNGFFIPPYDYDGKHDVSNIPPYARSMVYFWDPDQTGPRNLRLGYLGCKFLESPGNPTNGIDDDGDGMIDERQDDGIDNDGDWNPLVHDVGVDGIPNTGDEGEGDGVPTAGRKLPDGSPDPLAPGEPNFEYTDLDEADQIGLTSFNSWSWANDRISDDNSMWNRSTPQNFGDIQQNADIVFIFGSGYISLKRGETKRISMALLCGEDLDDLLISAETVQTIYNQNYQFFKPPVLPTVTAVPDDKKVTLYWDTKAEESIDPITGKDFEGYVIYRSTDPSFNDIQVITDGKGSGFFSEPLKDIDGFEVKFDNDIVDEPFEDFNFNGVYDAGEPFVDYNKDGKWTAGVTDPWKGYHPVSYQGRGIQYYLGQNTGLVHSYTDSNNVINGQTYYYAVVAYDHGDSTGIPPTETTKKITIDPITSKYRFDPNTVQVIPGPRASGYKNPANPNSTVKHDQGIGTGEVRLEILDDLALIDQNSYSIEFSDTLWANDTFYVKKNYSVKRTAPVEENFILYDTKFTKLKNSNLIKDSELKVSSSGGDVVYTEGTDYIIDYASGSIRRTQNSTMPSAQYFKISYRYYPVYQSTRFNLEDDNPVVDGVRIKVKDEAKLEVDTIKTRWVEGNSNFKIAVQKGAVGAGAAYPADYIIRFSDTFIDSALMIVTGGTKKLPVNYTAMEVTEGVPRKILTFLNEKLPKDSIWTPGDEIILFRPGAVGVPNETTWGVVISRPSDSTVTPIPPSEGSEVLIATKRPFDGRDVFSFSTEAPSFNNDNSSSLLDNIYVVPNPYVGVNEIEPTVKLPGQSRGERRIYFENLPPKCTIRIYTLSGEHVQTIEHETTLQTGREYWNLLNKDGFGVAYGVYFAHIDAPGIGEKIVKFALIK